MPDSFSNFSDYFIFKNFQNSHCEEQPLSESYSEHSQTSKIIRLAKIINDLKPLTIFANDIILEVWQCSKYDSALSLHFWK